MSGAIPPGRRRRGGHEGDALLRGRPLLRFGVARAGVGARLEGPGGLRTLDDLSPGVLKGLDEADQGFTAVVMPMRI